MTHIFKTDTGSALRLRAELQSRAATYTVVTWNDLQEVWETPYWMRFYSTLADAITSYYVTGRVRDMMMFEGDACAILELHPEHGIQLHRLGLTGDDQIEARLADCDAWRVAHRLGFVENAD
jgi:hypothetical protein